MLINSTKNYHASKLKFLVYGEAGAGKTSLAKTIEEPTLIISAEAGLLCLNDSNIDVLDITIDDSGSSVPKDKRINRLAEAFSYINSDEAREKYKWIFIDSLTEISQNLIEQLNVEFPERNQSLVMYGENSKRMRSLIKSFRDIPYYNIIFTALAEIDKDENNVRITNPSLVGNISTKVAAFFDEVFYLAVTQDEHGETKRVLLTEKTDRTTAKDRSGKLLKLEAPNLTAIANKIRG